MKLGPAPLMPLMLLAAACHPQQKSGELTPEDQAARNQASAQIGATLGAGPVAGATPATTAVPPAASTPPPPPPTH